MSETIIQVLDTRIILEGDIGELAAIPCFFKKVEAALKKAHGWSFRVHWKPYGWISFAPQPTGESYRAYQESAA